MVRCRIRVRIRDSVRWSRGRHSLNLGYDARGRGMRHIRCMRHRMYVRHAKKHLRVVLVCSDVCCAEARWVLQGLLLTPVA